MPANGRQLAPFACGGLECATSRRYLGMVPDQSSHLVEIVESCEDEFLRIMLDCDDEYDTPVYLDLRLLREATPRILERYDIPSDRSKDLR